jgi:hypothetical protein
VPWLKPLFIVTCLGVEKEGSGWIMHTDVNWHKYFSTQHDSKFRAEEPVTSWRADMLADECIAVLLLLGCMPC